MKTRRKPYGYNNMIGANVERLRKSAGMLQKDMVAKMQLLGVDINPSSLSKLEGQLRIATDCEVWAISRILRVRMEALFDASE